MDSETQNVIGRFKLFRLFSLNCMHSSEYSICFCNRVITMQNRASRLPTYMRNKSILIAIVMVSSSLAGCISDNSEENLNARYQEGYDAGYADAYDSSYDGVAQHNYNEGWDDGWAIANSDSEEIISNLGSNLSIQQNLVDEWIQNAIMNDFSGMNFSNFDMSGADLSGSNLTGANLIGTNLQSVIWSNTICPDGSNSDDNGNTCENNL